MKEASCLTTTEKEKSMSDPEIIELWGQVHGGTASDIRRQCPELKAKTLRKITEMCERLVTEGLMAAAKVPVPNGRYVGRSLEKSAEYLEHTT